MKIIKTKKELQAEIEQLKSAKKTIGFVPTMGALHAGHIALVHRCVSDNDCCVVSVFVNPTQFNNPDDLKKYPRDLKKDVSLLEAAGVCLVFAPEADEMYSAEEINTCFDFDFGGLDKVMEGKFRPGHFNGVVQVVSKLFSLVKPDRAYFGEKDFQQLAIIHRMTELMDFPVRIVDCSIVREPSGLAMSSRNERLTDEQRKKAAKISEVLFESRNFVSAKSPKELAAWVVDKINAVDGLNVEYYDIVDAVNLTGIEEWNDNCIGCIAVFCGDVRLIDNIRY
ncbi:pantoate--beta-alanine ligase [Paludibacter sp. 221]|uniref:pantoate--beta-alanine ligase n=1 Tax=Paludibacter sp. 221 TaxID=2302939 RepID=UPI0013D27532|nr:pantoate--beta-alanine ligase [Paludibacter sp. 221]NDV47946.1 pantoate--beta-alanine ligase [Paludibacter sp. 221]